MNNGEIAGLTIVLLMSGLVAGWAAGTTELRIAATKTECAQYNPTTGNFEWLPAPPQDKPQ